MIARAMMSSARPDWNTPAIVLDAVRRLGPIELDPCSNEGSIVGATTTCDGAIDGLALDWAATAGDGIVYVNPPYGRAIGAWTAKCADEERAGAEIVALLPARTDTAWWHRDVMTARSICLWRGRLTFLGAPGPAPFPSAVAYWGPRRADFEAALAEHGLCVRP